MMSFSKLWKEIRGGLIFGVACFASPCCTPLWVPLTLVLLAGTPFAVWMTANIGWVFGGLTLISLAGFVVGFRWLWPQLQSKKESQPGSPLASQQTITSKEQ